MEIEQWKEIEHYEYLYQVSNRGRIRNSKGLILSLQKDKNGYSHCTLYRGKIAKTVRIHRIVAIAFIPNMENKPQVNHINGIRTDNNIENLEWVTNSENQLHAFLKLGKKKSGCFCNSGFISSKSPRSKAITQLDLNGNTIREWVCARDISRQLGISYQHISNCCHGKEKTAGGFMWNFKN